MENTEIGRRLGIRSGIRIQDVPLTDYSFYQPFYENPSPNAFQYPLDDYFRVRTSGTSGLEKWFMLPKAELKNAIPRSIIANFFTAFHNGERCTLEYGDTIFFLSSPGPFIGGEIMGEAGNSRFMKMLPNINLSFREKIDFFIRNHQKF